MICSFVVALRPKDEKPIYKYINFRYIKELLKNEMGIEDLKKITISNFLTKDKFLEKKHII